MCGILGGFFQNPNKNIKQQFQSALKKIDHRGPDDCGSAIYNLQLNSALILGHTRLSILDLSSAGHQPMTTEDGRITIVFNGEVYNYKELRLELQDQGYLFKTKTDTEVLLNAFHLWGVSCLKKLTGMFSFCVYDRSKEKITLVRDAFGIKPLFYTQTNNHLIFSSELNPILELLGTKPQPDLQTAYNYLVHGDYESTEQTFFAGIKHLRPASYIEFDLTVSKLSQPIIWWEPKTEEDKTISFENAVEQVREKFLNCVRLHLRSDVPVGAALSGGVDSSALVCAMHYLEPDMPIHTFSYIADGSEKSEEKWVDLVNARTNAIGHKVVSNPGELMHDLTDLIKSQGEPFGSTSIYAQYRVFQLAKEQGIKVTLDGQGADELLAGYIGYPGERLLSLIETSKIKRAFQFSNLWSKWSGRRYKQSWMYLGRKILPDSIYKFARRLLGRNFEPEWLNMVKFKDFGVKTQENRMIMSPEYKGRRVIEQLAYSLKNRGLPSLLRHGDRNSMRFSIESRVPFLTTDMVDYLYTLPENFLISDTGETKHVFRCAMQGILPQEIIERKDKIGFEIDSISWKNLYIKEIEQFEIGSLSDLIDLKLFVRTSESADEKLCWRMLNYIKWYDAFFNKKIESSYSS